MNILGTRWRYRLGGDELSTHGGKAERGYIDFTVDGVSLGDTLRARQRDLIGILGWGDPKYDLVVVDQLLLRAKPTLATGRQLLYGCSECGDLGCGAITADIAESGTEVRWSSFGFENNYDPGMSDFESYQAVGPFRFDRDQYDAAVRGALVRRE